MNYENVILSYLNNYPGSSSKKIFSYLKIKTKDNNKIEENVKESAVYRKLRLLRKEGKLHNIGNSWFPLKKSS